MRLIDADKLPYEDVESVDGNTYMCVNAYDIEHAPTIEQSEDCISRAYVEPVVEELENICINGDEHILSLLSDIKNAPPVTSQRPKGRWIYSKYHTWICSVCGENTLKYTGVVPSEEKMKKRWRYCSICGAEMEGEDKNEI